MGVLRRGASWTHSVVCGKERSLYVGIGSPSLDQALGLCVHPSPSREGHNAADFQESEGVSLQPY